ncbi:interferon-induced very large GTPase 1-like [Clinocottus analis]|uniref:interferon-induced very large GTPase 1-like n=1 Tax=Clinocottus analis TaxID=304258 RepID=UPI0035BF134F
MSGNMDNGQPAGGTKTLLDGLLDRLQLQDEEDKKLSPADFLKIGPAVKQDSDTSEKDVARSFIQRLMMLDYRARYIPVRQDRSEASNSNPVEKSVTDDDDDDDALFTTNADSEVKTHVHPMDVQMAVFHCSDSFLKQNLITKLSQCQYALPLLVPDPVTGEIVCPLWTFRQIRKTWKITEMRDNSNNVTLKSVPICTAETALVSFLRLGSPSLSKSQLMNTLINDRHSTFFHRNCPGSTESRHLMGGVAEIAWFCPNAKPNDAFTDCVAFCNLHGDALSVVKQRDILTDKSSVNVVLVPTLEQGEESSKVISALFKSPKPLIILIAENAGGVSEMKKGKYKMGLKNKSHSDVSEELKKIIRKILSGQHSSFQLESMAEGSAVKVDEDDKVCREGKTAAITIVHLLKEMEVSNFKDTHLPRQSQLWHDWCKINKEICHLKHENMEQEKDAKETKQRRIREDQRKAPLSEPIQLFIESLSSLKEKEKGYFLKWTQILIDAFSTDKLSSNLHNYDEKWAELLALKKNKDQDQTALLKMQTELEKISTKVESATFGLEHIFREMGQIYEAHAELKEQRKEEPTDWSKYPELAAELMISGQPMELMDGDAGHVPLTWISGLLDKVTEKLGDKRVFVLSVLGVQSSGKSTMLNAMFGLQFAVSAGRCTKGAFMQLVKVSEEIREDYKFDYVLVLDTEGLHALELEGKTNRQHDNELATFVVGLGDITLININGESPADMQDVLQIVVQAFMRMKEVKLSPSCVFVHQNVTDISATEKNMEGKRRLQEKLDKMAELAAKEEDCVAECFSDIIAFDLHEDVKYFAPLWEGSPPMAPPNPGYSESVQELKTIILSKASQSAGITLSGFNSKIQDLWEALMNEQFVFSFKNTLEVAVYRKLEVQYGNWTWSLRSNLLTIEDGLHTNIENGRLEKVLLSDLRRESEKIEKEIKKSMAAYFDEDRDKEMLVQWRGKFETKMKEFHEERMEEVQRKLNGVIEQKHACKTLDAKKEDFENTLLQKSKDLACDLKDIEMNEKELEEQFNSVWRDLVKKLIADTKPIQDINYEEDQSTVLWQLGFEDRLINESKRSGRYKQMTEAGDYTHYGKGLTHKVKNFFTGRNDEQKLIRSLIEDVVKQSLELMKSKPVAVRGYNTTYLQEVGNLVKGKVTEFESQKKFALLKEFTVDVSLYVFHRAESWLLTAHKTFKRTNDAHSYVEGKKEKYLSIFKSFCKGSSSAVVLGELICDKLKSSTVKAVCKKTVIQLAREMKSNVPAFNGNKSTLEKHMLKSLAEDEDFKAFMTYIRNPQEQTKTYIREEVHTYIFTEHGKKAQDIFQENVEEVKKYVKQALINATKNVRREGGGPEMWVKECSSLLKEKLTFETVCFENFSDVTDYEFLQEEIEKGLKSVMQEVSRRSLDHIEEIKTKTEEILIEQLCDCCWEKCPFCSAVCVHTMNDHDGKHSVRFHRCEAVKGMHYRNTKELSIDFCTTSVSSDGGFYPQQDSQKSVAYKEYQTAGPPYQDWEITPDKSKMEYWKWFVSHFKEQLEKHHDLKFQGRGEIPSGWKCLKQEAIRSLDKL